MVPFKNVSLVKKTNYFAHFIKAVKNVSLGKKKKKKKKKVKKKKINCTS